MYHHHPETNPYFSRPQTEDRISQPPPRLWAQRPQRQDQHEQASGPWAPQPQRQDQQDQATGPLAPPPQRQDQQAGPWVKRPRRQGKNPKPVRPLVLQPRPKSQDQQHTQSQESPPPPGQYPGALVPLQPQHGGKQHPQPKHQSRYPLQPHSPEVLQPQPHGQHPRMPPPRKTSPVTWSAAFCCAIFWVVIILGGVIVLIIYLVFRPLSPRFGIATVTLNAAYLDMGYLLNADLTVLANFTNPNKKVKVDFSYTTLDLYYGRTLIATQYVEPFSAARAQNMLTEIHLVSSQVRLPLREIQQLQKQIASNGVIFKIKGSFRARSELGSFLRYSYWLYGYCRIIVTGPPTGVLKASVCRTKR